MAQRGGYRKPNNPAPVSGPGSLSRRTDGGPGKPARQGAMEMPSSRYGEGTELQSLQTSAPMAGNRTPVRKMPPVTPLTAPTERPDEPPTAGMPFGDGPGPEVLPAFNMGGPRALSDIVSEVASNDPTGELNDLYEYLILRGM